MGIEIRENFVAQEYKETLGNRQPDESRPFAPTYQVLLSPPRILVAEDLG
jgi:hypothetical protein